MALSGKFKKHTLFFCISMSGQQCHTSKQRWKTNDAIWDHRKIMHRAIYVGSGSVCWEWVETTGKIYKTKQQEIVEDIFTRL